MATRPRRPTLLLTLLLAVALHLIGAALVLLLWPRETKEGRSSRIEWHEVQLVASPSPTIERRTTAAPPAMDHTRERTAPERARPTRKRARPAPEHVRRSPTARSTPSKTVRKTKKPFDLRMRPLDLSPSPDLFAGEVPAPGDPKGRTLSRPRSEDRVAEASRVKGRIDRWLREDEGRRNVRHGRAHPALFAVLRRAQRLFSPTEQMIPSRLRDPKREYLSAYTAGIDAFNKMGKALPFDYKDFGQEVTPAKMLAGNAFIKKHTVNKGSQELVTEICIRAAPDRRPVVKQQRSCGIKVLDRHARRAMDRALARAMPADLPRTAACHRFKVSYGRVLPTPSLDYLCGVFTNPGGKYMQHEVRLVAVWPEGIRAR
jgi:hypothetical protein